LQNGRHDTSIRNGGTSESVLVLAEEGRGEGQRRTAKSNRRGHRRRREEEKGRGYKQRRTGKKQSS
jgi:hypothetical protein